MQLTLTTIVQLCLLGTTSALRTPPICLTRRSLLPAAAAAIFSGPLSTLPARAADPQSGDCKADCFRECNAVAPGNDGYCKDQCDTYCADNPGYGKSDVVRQDLSEAGGAGGAAPKQLVSNSGRSCDSYKSEAGRNYCLKEASGGKAAPTTQYEPGSLSMNVSLVNALTHLSF